MTRTQWTQLVPARASPVQKILMLNYVNTMLKEANIKKLKQMMNISSTDPSSSTKSVRSETKMRIILSSLIAQLTAKSWTDWIT